MFHLCSLSESETDIHNNVHIKFLFSSIFLAFLSFHISCKENHNATINVCTNRQQMDSIILEENLLNCNDFFHQNFRLPETRPWQVLHLLPSTGLFVYFLGRNDVLNLYFFTSSCRRKKGFHCLRQLYVYDMFVAVVIIFFLRFFAGSFLMESWGDCWIKSS